MRVSSSSFVASSLCAVLALPASAAADEDRPERTRVHAHVRATRPVAIMRATPQGDVTVCTTPCDFLTEPDTTFEIQAPDTLRDMFTVRGEPGQDFWLDVTPASQSGRAGAITAGALFGALGGLVATWGLLRAFDGNLRLPTGGFFSAYSECSDLDPRYSECTSRTDRTRATQRDAANAEIRSGNIMMLAGVAVVGLGGAVILAGSSARTRTVRRVPLPHPSQATASTPPSREPTWLPREPRMRCGRTTPLLTIRF